MGDIIKRYNDKTKQWEVSAAGDTDGIAVTDPRLLDPESEVTAESLTDVLVRHDEKLKRFGGNIAWLAEHGGGGSGGGGGATGDVITLTNANIVKEGNINYLYSTTTTNIKLDYLITSSKNNKRYLITVTLDGNELIKDKEGYTNTPGSITIPKLDAYTSNASHSVIITANDTDGFLAQTYMLTIVEASIKLSSSVSSSTATVGIDYFITYTVTSKIVGAEVNLVVTNITNGAVKTIELGKTTSTAPKQVNVNLWDLGSIIAGSSYTIQGQAFTSLNEATVQSEPVINRAVVEDGVNLVVLVEGVTTKEEVEVAGIPRTKFSQSGNISFAFTPYLAGVSLIYYATRLEHNGVIKDIGYFDEGNYNANQYVQRGKQQVFSYAIPTEGDILGNWNITLRCWSEKGNPVTDVILACEVVSSSNALIADQNPNNSRYAMWHIRQETFPQLANAKQWISNEPQFTSPGSIVPEGAVCNLNLINTNGVLSGFLTEKGQSAMRIAGEAYGVIDLQPFKDDVNSLTNWSKQGFAISCTFNTDIHPYSNRTVFFIGDYNTDEQFSEGIKIGLDTITWSYTDGNIKETISCKIQQNVVNTVDFVVNKNPDKKLVSIFVNGVPNVAREIKNDFTWKTSSKIYLGCDVSNAGKIQNYSDVNFYDIKLFRVPTNDKEVVINKMNAHARATLLSDGSIDFVAYNQAKLRNFFSTSDNTPQSTLWDDVNNTYANINFASLISDTTKTLPVDIMLLNCANTGFTRAVFQEIGGTNNNWYTGCTLSYFSPTSGKSSSEQTTDVAVSKQGTSTLNNLIKNLEIRFDKMLKDDDGGNLDYEMFQPKETWFPERQFTLKADVVDSSHANNASIGKWINDNADFLFEKTPPMEELESRRPFDTREPTKRHEKVTIKQTLEGFPVILLIQFDGEETQTMLGIYSFNLGRGAYYNMGFRFLKDFTTKIKNTAGEYVDNKLPAFVTSYHAYGQDEKFGSIDQREIYSYEFTENANVIVDGNKTLPLALFMQDDLSIIKHVGEFKYNGGNWLEPTAAVTDDNVWKSLQELFSLFAQMTTSTTKKYVWNDTSGGYEETAGEYPAQSSWSTLAAELDTKFSIKNAYSYFLTCIKHGLVDSLGKNLTLVRINGKWWIRFYDMDTANALDNVSLESVAKTAYLDTFSNNKTSAVNSLVITKNAADGGYDTYSSRMWDVFRDTIFYNTGIFDSTLEALWDLWRNNDSICKDINDYVDNYFAAQTKNCGEFLFNYDYNVKYFTAYVGEQGGAASYANIEALHGTRIEFVRDWLRKRVYFFDGVFKYANANNIQPYNYKGTFSAGGAEASNPKFTVTSNIPAIFVVNVGNTSDTRYFLPEGEPTEISMSPISSFNTQITINNISQINDIEGLKDIRFQRFMSSMKLPSFSKLNLFSVDTLSNNPIPFETVFVNDKGFSDVRHIDLSNTKFWAGSEEGTTFTVNIEKYTKLKDINIANSVVTSMSLPNASLASLNITNSTIETIKLSNQPFLETIDFSGCRRLKSVTIDSCEKITELNLSGLGDLTTLSITSCPNLVSIIATNNVNLTTFNVSNCNAVKNINISQCTNRNLSIYIVGAPNIESLDVSSTNTANDIQAAANLPNLRNLKISNSEIVAIQYGNAAIPTYKENKIFDISKLNLTNLSVQNAKGVRYFKFDNNRNTPFNVGSSFFVGCSNLKRVFGHIKLNGTSTFAQCSNFYIHEPKEKVDGITPMYNGEWFGSDTSTTEGKTAWDNNTDLGTNFTIGTTNCASMFNATNCSIYDVYYFLYKCDNVTTLDDCFSSAKNVKWDLLDSPNRTMFNHCTKVVTMNSLFSGLQTQDFKILTSTYDYDSTEHNGLFSPLVDLQAMDNIFYFDGIRYTSPSFLVKFKGNIASKLKRLSDFSGTIKFVGDINNCPSDSTIDNHLVNADCGTLLSNLPDLEYLNSMFNNSNIDFNQITDEDVEDGVTYCPLFYKNTKLRYIQDSFKGLVNSTGSLYNIFGGTVKNKTQVRFPTALYGIYNSFSLGSGSNVIFPIHNSMFSRLRNSLKYITGQQAINESTLGSFQGFTKQFLKEEDEVFPYNVFTGCNQLVECPGFFSYMSLPAGSVVELPLNSFKTNYNLTNIAYLYYGLKNCNYTMTGKGFSNCKLVNVNHCFAELGTTYVKKGMIPYGLFYMEQTTIQTFKGWSLEDAGTIELDENFGITSGGEWIPDEDAPMPDEITYTKQRTLPRKTIVNMSYCLEKFQSVEAQGYSMNYGSLTKTNYGDIIVPNEKYNPCKYIVNPNYDPREWLDDDKTISNYNRDIHRIKLNPDYDPYELAWNIYACDGIAGLADVVRNSSLYTAVSSGEINCNPTLPTEFEDTAASIAPPSSEHDNKKVLNYLCPPDLYYYCTNGNNMAIEGVFNGSGEITHTLYDHGVRGRLCPYLFKPVSNVTNLSYTFYLCVNLNPYRWNAGATGAVGDMFAETTFSGLSKLTKMSYMFCFVTIPENVILPSNLLSDLIQLQDIEGLFLYAQFLAPIGSLRQQVDDSFFSKNVLLRNVSYALASGKSIKDLTARSPKKIGSALLNSSTHKHLNNVTGFLYNATTTGGSVPEFWNWLNALPVTSRANVFYGMNKNLLTNGNSIPSGWDTGMS
nr:MAG TPA: leucine-rich repeat protein [Crassvirales sp.]